MEITVPARYSFPDLQEKYGVPIVDCKMSSADEHGIYHRIDGRQSIIILNKDNDSQTKLVTAYHELGHHFNGSKEGREPEEVIDDELRAWLWARRALEKDGYFALRGFRNDFRTTVSDHLDSLRQGFPVPVGWQDTLQEIIGEGIVTIPKRLASSNDPGSSDSEFLSACPLRKRS